MYTDDWPSTEQQPCERPIRYVLFVCNYNAGRSQMAEAFFARYGPDDVRAESAGTEPAPEIWPPVLAYRRARECLRRETCELLTQVSS